MKSIAMTLSVMATLAVSSTALAQEFEDDEVAAPAAPAPQAAPAPTKKSGSGGGVKPSTPSVSKEDFDTLRKDFDALKKRVDEIKPEGVITQDQAWTWIGIILGLTALMIIVAIVTIVLIRRYQKVRELVVGEVAETKHLAEATAEALLEKGVLKPEDVK